MDAPPELEVSFEEALGGFQLSKPISPDTPTSSKWDELEAAVDDAAESIVSDALSPRDDESVGDEAEAQEFASDATASTMLGNALATLWPQQENIYSPNVEPMINLPPLRTAFVDTDIDVPMGKMRSQVKTPWTRLEDQLILEGVDLHGHKWSKIAMTLPQQRTDDAVRNRWHRLRNKASRRSPPADTDYTLPALKRQCSSARSSLADAAAEDSASGNEDPTQPPRALAAISAPPEPAGKHGDMWTTDEDLIIDHAVRVRGLRWKAIAALLPGRTESGCRNRWVRNQERVFAAAGIPVHGAAAVFAALKAACQLQQPQWPQPVVAAAH